MQQPAVQCWPFTMLCIHSIAQEKIASISTDQDEAHIWCEPQSILLDSTAPTRSTPTSQRDGGGSKGSQMLNLSGHTLKMNPEGNISLADVFQHLLDVGSIVQASQSQQHDGDGGGGGNNNINNSGRNHHHYSPTMRMLTILAGTLKKTRVVFRGNNINNSNNNNNNNNNGSRSSNAAGAGAVCIPKSTNTLCASNITGTLVFSAPSTSSSPATSNSNNITRGSAVVAMSSSSSIKQVYHCEWDLIHPLPIATERRASRVALSTFANRVTMNMLLHSNNCSNGLGSALEVFIGVRRDRTKARFVMTNHLQTASKGSGGAATTASSLLSSVNFAKQQHHKSDTAVLASSPSSAQHQQQPVSAAGAGAPSPSSSSCITATTTNSPAIITSSNGEVFELSGGVPSLDQQFYLIYLQQQTPSSSSSLPQRGLLTAAATAATQQESQKQQKQSDIALPRIRVQRVWWDPLFSDRVVVLTRTSSSALDLSVCAVDDSATTYFPTRKPGEALVPRCDIHRFFAADSGLDPNDLADPHAVAFIIGDVRTVKMIVLCCPSRGCGAEGTTTTTSTTTSTSSSPLAGTAAAPPPSTTQQRFVVLKADRNSLCAAHPCAFTSHRPLSFAFLRSGDLCLVSSPVEHSIYLVDALFPRVLLRCSLDTLARSVVSPTPASASLVSTTTTFSDLSLFCWGCSGGGSWLMRRERLVLCWNSTTTTSSKKRNVSSSSPPSSNNNTAAASTNTTTNGFYCVMNLSAAEMTSSIHSLLMLATPSSDNAAYHPSSSSSPASAAAPVQQQQHTHIAHRLAAKNIAHIMFVIPRLPYSSSSSSFSMTEASSPFLQQQQEANHNDDDDGSNNFGSVLPRVKTIVRAIRHGTATSRWGALVVAGWIDAEIRCKWDAILRSACEDHPVALLGVAEVMSLTMAHSAAKKRLGAAERQQHRQQQQHAAGSLLGSGVATSSSGKQQQQAAPVPTKAANLQAQAMSYAAQLQQKREQQQQKQNQKQHHASADPAAVAATSMMVSQQQQHSPYNNNNNKKPSLSHQQQPLPPSRHEVNREKFVNECLDASKLVWDLLSDDRISALTDQHCVVAPSQQQQRRKKKLSVFEIMHLLFMFSEAIELCSLGLDGGLSSSSTAGGVIGEVALQVEAELQSVLRGLLNDYRSDFRQLLPHRAYARFKLSLLNQRSHHHNRHDASDTTTDSSSSPTNSNVKAGSGQEKKKCVTAKTFVRSFGRIPT